MNKSKTRRHRQRRNKLSRRMKKRGGGHHRTKSQRQPSRFKEEERPSFFERNRDPEYNDKRDAAFARFNHQYKEIQDRYIQLLLQGQEQDRWVEVCASKDLTYNVGVGKWKRSPPSRDRELITDFMLLTRMQQVTTHPDIYGHSHWDPVIREYTETPNQDTIAFLESLKWLSRENREGKFWIPRVVAIEHRFL